MNNRRSSDIISFYFDIFGYCFKDGRASYIVVDQKTISAPLSLGEMKSNLIDFFWLF